MGQGRAVTKAVAPPPKRTETTEEIVARFRNARRPLKAGRLSELSSAKQSLVGDYSCCGQIP